jgi:FtsP/CotA-like multicopper oxidase with cupredoxin domain
MAPIPKQSRNGKKSMASWKDKLALTAQRNRQEIVKAHLTRRDMMRAGLLTAGGSLIVKAGLSSRAATAGGTPASPPIRPWVQELPMLPIAQAVASASMSGGEPDGTTPIDGATKRVNHQLCTYDGHGGYGGLFPPKKFYELTMSESSQKYHPDYSATRIWGFNGTVPGPNIQARYGEPILVRFHNHLPSVKTPQDFGIAEMTTHLHNGHTPSESDGNPVNYFNSINDPNAINPLGFKDQHYPNVLAGYTARKDLVGDPSEAMGSLWYHDHHLDYTAQNVYKGMHGAYTLFDDKDTGNEGTGLQLPSGKYDVPIMFSDPLFDQNCQLVFDLFNLDGILGDRFAANGVIQPVCHVDKRRYRFRLYAPGPSRWWEFALFDGKNHIPFWQISSDGNLLPQAVAVSSVRLGVAERADIIIDFSKINTSGPLYLVNVLEQTNGRGPTGKVLSPGQAIIQFIVGSPAPDFSHDLGNPADPKAAPYSLRALPDPDFGALQARAAKAKVRNWVFERGNGAWQVNGKFFDENTVSAAIPQESEEVWVIKNGGGGWMHPVHIHFEEHRVLARNGVTVTPNTQINGCINYARKDVVPLADGEEVRIFMRFRDMKGRYVMHCHNVVHEDHAMMVRWDIV